MTGKDTPQSRVHDLLGALMGLFALGMLVTSPWQVDTSGPEPFYKGPLIFPMVAFCLMVCGALPSFLRLVRPPEMASWYLDGKGIHGRTLGIAGLLVGYMAGLVWMGLEVSTWLFLMITLPMVGHGSKAKLTLIPLGVALVLYVMFKWLLDIWFPQPLLLELFLE
ncbi:MAG: tripartite tricarboxylate transporter TctB family protein [Pseudomonadota bacterium]